MSAPPTADGARLPRAFARRLDRARGKLRRAAAFVIDDKMLRAPGRSRKARNDLNNG